jgi:hypothetical protein
MKSAVMPGLLSSLIMLLLSFAVLPGCETGIPNPPPVDSELTVWLGTYSSSGGDDSGVIMLDITRSGGALTAEAIFRSRESESPYDHFYLKGSAHGDNIELSLDTDMIPYIFEFDLDLVVGSGGSLAGSFYHSAYDMTGDIECTRLETADAAVDTFVDIKAAGLGLAFDGEHVWMSASGRDYILIDSSCALVDTVAVLFEYETHWVSDALTSDGSLLFGGYPVAVTGPGGTRNESDIIVFEKNGDISRRFRIGHRTSGLAWSGEYLWSLSTGSDYFYKLDLDGTNLESVSVGVPDLVDIEFDGTDFWAIGWFMKRMYRISSAGEVLTVYHLPGEYGFIYPAGLVFDGTHFWYSFNTSYFETRIYKLRAE